MEFDKLDYWKAIVLYGLNASTYKMSFGISLINAARENKNEIYWDDLSKSFLNNYEKRLETNPMPQLSNSNRLTEMEKITRTLQIGKINRTQAIEQVGRNAFDDVVHRFQTIGMDKRIAKDMFYETHFGNKLILKDSLLSFTEHQLNELEEEILARWSLLEGAFEINKENFALANDIRDIYLLKGHERKNLTTNIPFLSGYQGNICFYCGEPMTTVHVDHVLARQVLLHDEVWNLVLAHADCNMLKSDRLVAEHYIIKLIARNENIMGSNHPWKKKIKDAVGNTPNDRASNLRKHYENVKVVLGINNYWGGNANFRPDQDPFFRRLITKLNNR